ncbi:tetratricopeptide repeat (TPR)-containing protein [Striga asiatica]|uniref:Tetratricopeptide repeat (TPR)-containing protein n=1 Tax=Striga asiatica TaxID=4170 RepID=A0A5A7RB53_STRAF|nr:tetratricopeptide repeat (TPR)-containing protein [Striga asiatica]
MEQSQRATSVHFMVAFPREVDAAAAAVAGSSHTTAGTSSAPSQTPLHATADDEPHQESSQLPLPIPGHSDAYSDRAPVRLGMMPVGLLSLSRTTRVGRRS